MDDLERAAELERAVDEVAAGTDFSGAVRVDGPSGTMLAKAYGLADRANRLPNTVHTRFGTASCVKGFTALTVMSLVNEGRLTLDTTARSVLGADLPLIDDEVAVEHLLAHRSGIGDYLDENVDLDVTDYVLPIPVHELVSTEDYLRVLDGFPQKFPPGERFEYCNSAFVVLALIAERTGGRPFAELVRRVVTGPAAMADTEFLRSDELPGGTAIGYLTEKDPRTNIFHLPVVGTGDGGIYTTLADMHRFWDALLGGRILPQDLVELMLAPRSDAPEESMRFGLGFYLHASTTVAMLTGCDAGVSFLSAHDPESGRTYTVVSNTTDGAWPVNRRIRAALGGNFRVSGDAG